MFQEGKAHCAFFPIGEPVQIELMRSIKGKHRLYWIRAQDDKEYVLKLELGSDVTREYLEQQGVFSNELAGRGCLVAKRVRAQNGAYVWPVKEGYVVMENYIEGSELEGDPILPIEQMAQLMGQFHRHSLAAGVSFGHGTTWSFFGGNATDRLGDYDENELCFLELLEFTTSIQDHQALDSQIADLYRKRRSELQAVWSTLPMAAVQGDFCPYNMKQNKGSLNVLDFNLSGDEVLVNEMIAVGIYVTHFYQGEKYADSLQRWIDHYAKERPLTKDERQIIPTLIQVIYPFRHDRVNSIYSLYKNGEPEQALKELRETIELLQASSEQVASKFKLDERVHIIEGNDQGTSATNLGEK